MKGGVDKFSKSFLFRDTQNQLKAQGKVYVEAQDETGEYVSNVAPLHVGMGSMPPKLGGTPVEPLTAFQMATAIQADYLNPIIPFKEVKAKIKQFEDTYGKTFGEVLRMGEYVSNVVSIRPKTETSTFEWYALRRARASECASAPVLVEGYQSFVVGVDGINYVVALV